MGKDITIIVNGREKVVAKEDMTFNEIVVLQMVRMQDRPKDAATVAVNRRWFSAVGA